MTSAPYQSCDTCHTKMQGIRDHSARTTCYGCGGRPLISDGEAYQQMLVAARARVARPESRPISPRNPNSPMAA